MTGKSGAGPCDHLRSYSRATNSTMAGKPFKVGRFAHTLRVRLMREHLGVDVDTLDEEDLMANEPVQPEYTENTWDPDTEQKYGQEDGVTHIKKSKQKTPIGALLHDTLDGANQGVLSRPYGPLYSYAVILQHYMQREKPLLIRRRRPCAN